MPVIAHPRPQSRRRVSGHMSPSGGAHRPGLRRRLRGEHLDHRRVVSVQSRGRSAPARRCRRSGLRPLSEPSCWIAFGVAVGHLPFAGQPEVPRGEHQRSGSSRRARTVTPGGPAAVSCSGPLAEPTSWRASKPVRGTNRHRRPARARQAAIPASHRLPPSLPALQHQHQQVGERGRPAWAPRRDCCAAGQDLCPRTPRLCRSEGGFQNLGARAGSHGAGMALRLSRPRPVPGCPVVPPGGRGCPV